MDKANYIYLRLVDKPPRKALVKRGVAAREYMSYCLEVGCDVWEQLRPLAAPGEEPVCLWLPDAFRAPGTSVYVQGVERPLEDNRPVPEGLDTIILPAATYLLFQGMPFAEEDYAQAVHQVQQAMDAYDPAVLGLQWDDESPRVQLEPVGSRGYMEMRAVKPL